jgi:hypothetical protein
MTSLDAENSSMETLIHEAERETVNFGQFWKNSDFHKKQELQRGFFPEGLVYHPEKRFFERSNHTLFQGLMALLDDIKNFGVPDGI